MTDSKHTPGPYSAAPSAIDRDTWCVWGDVKYETGNDGWYHPCLAKTMNGQDAREGSADEARANAHLFAAAKDLLEALEEYVDAVDPNEVNNNKAIDALAKANGEQS